MNIYTLSPCLTVDSHIRRKTSAEQKRSHVTSSKPITKISALSVRAVPLKFNLSLLCPLCLRSSARENQSKLKSVRMCCRARSKQTASLLNLTEIHTTGNVVISSEDGTENSPVVITSLDIDFSLEGFKANFANILGGGAAGDLINSLINENGLEIVTQYKTELSSFISKTFISFVNERLQSYTLKEILDYLGVTSSSR
uniref:Uncharacterized protein n=1 Tax=Timema poppense TaxID=170557 RepID=A0A7R9DS37_TIMPO|nr:unnamed protein product [Timema poppensis]